MKKYVYCLTMLLVYSITNGLAFATATDATNDYISSETIKCFNQESGEIVDINQFDLTQDNAKWRLSGGANFKFLPLDGKIGCYSYVPSFENSTSTAQSNEYMILKPNRNYKVSALIKTNFNRANCEINIGMALSEKGENNKKVLRDIRFSGVKAKTNGWELYEYNFTTGPSIEYGRFYIATYGFKDSYTEQTVSEDLFCISKVEIAELPKTERKAFKKGEGVVFRGGAGNLDMKITKVEEKSSEIIVSSTGARYSFDMKNNTINAYQLVNEDRLVSRWELSVPLTGLTVIRKTEKEVVLSNEHLTFGIQLDGMLLVTIHSTVYSDLNVTLTSQIAGKWNRYSYGNLIVMDEIGGFTANQVLVNGTGETPQSQVVR